MQKEYFFPSFIVWVLVTAVTALSLDWGIPHIINPICLFFLEISIQKQMNWASNTALCFALLGVALQFFVFLYPIISFVLFQFGHVLVLPPEDNKLTFYRARKDTVINTETIFKVTQTFSIYGPRVTIFFTDKSVRREKKIRLYYLESPKNVVEKIRQLIPETVT